MKRNIAIILALVLMMSVVLFGCGKKEDSEEANKEETVQQNDTNAPNQGGDIVITPGANGTDEGTGTTAGSDVTPSTDATETTGATAPSDTTNPSVPDTTPSQPSGTQQPAVPQTSSKIDKYRQIFASGTYSMTIITVEEGIEDIPVDFACKNGNIRMGMSMEGIPATMIYIAENDTMYMLFEMFGKFYTELTEELMGEEIDFSEATKEFQIPADATVVAGKEEFDGKTVDTETIKTDSKETVFYFDNSGNLIGIKTTVDSESSVTKISNLSTNVDDSLFEIPSDYKFMDMSWLMNMA